MFHLHRNTRHSVTYASYVVDENNINSPYYERTYCLLSHVNVLSAKGTDMTLFWDVIDVSTVAEGHTVTLKQFLEVMQVLL